MKISHVKSIVEMDLELNPAVSLAHPSCLIFGKLIDLSETVKCDGDLNLVILGIRTASFSLLAG